MITALLERTLEFRRGRFEPLILEIIRAGLLYRQKQGNPVKPDEIDRLNGLLLEVSFKFPDLWDLDFKASLHTDAQTRAKEHVERAMAEEKLRDTESTRRSLELEILKRQFFDLHEDANRQRAGLELRKF